MPRIKSILAFAAISAAMAASATGIAGAVPTVEHSLPWCSIPKADRISGVRGDHPHVRARSLLLRR